MDELARLADEYGSGELRLTVEQNIVIPNIENSMLEKLLREPILKDRFLPEPPILMKGLVACTGNQFCGQAIIETKARAMKVTEEVERLVSVSRPVRMHWTGCPNTCGQGPGGGYRVHGDLVPVVVDILVSHFGAVPREREEGED
ncbi:nitrite reductase 1 [Actinidia rufa]|uniref:Ferredoxin--nitrite reductase, chloroplastic n=1 Tax=Actinidia rufa TaxID=165716 RepID=A0A7J0ESY9_9ERIC|nr:nitrite reductase 1 [Actinidia rufa]